MGVTGAAAHACRLCGADLPDASLLVLPGAPRGAQMFVADADADADRPITLEIRHCGACGLVQACNEPVPDWQHVRRSSGYSPAMRDVRRRQFAALLARVARPVPRVLEAGSGPGDNLSILADCGAHAFGIEASRTAAQTCVERGLAVQAVYPTRGVVLEGGPFDAFVTTNVLEHAVDPRDFLAGIRENLVGGAIGLVEVPSFERMVEGRRVYDVVADHLSYFTSSTLRLTLELCGFEVLDVGHDWWPDDLTAVVRLRAPVVFDGAQVDLDRAVAAVRAFLDAHTGKGAVAVWGASHQALTLLALAHATDVAYVVDSAPFKQGRLTPATHLRVVPPTQLNSSPPAAVLVMAAGYSDEVTRILRTEHGYLGCVGVLRDGGVEQLEPVSRDPP
jgi:SAM-dependent methyltransferase